MSAHLFDDDRPAPSAAERGGWGRLPPPWVYMPGEETEEDRQRAFDLMAEALRRPPPMQYLPGEERQEAVLARLVRSVTGVEIAREEKAPFDDGEEGAEPRVVAAPYVGLPDLGRKEGWWDSGPDWTRTELVARDTKAEAAVAEFWRDQRREEDAPPRGFGGGAVAKHGGDHPFVDDLDLPPSIDHVGPQSVFGEALDASNDTASGRVIDLTGTKTALYAIVTDRTVWRWDRDRRTGWERLRGGPDGARWIAAVPEDPNHLFVGTENGLSPVASDAGLWETLDGGESWRYLFNPLLWRGMDKDANQSVSGLVVARGGTAYFVTGYGLGRYRFSIPRPGPGGGGGAAPAAQGPPVGAGVERVSTVRGLVAVAENGLSWPEHRLWMLDSMNQLYRSDDEGATWGPPRGLPAQAPFQGRPPEAVTWFPGPESRRMAAVGSRVAIYGYPTKDSVNQPVVVALSADGATWAFETTGAFLGDSGARGLRSFSFLRRQRSTAERNFGQAWHQGARTQDLHILPVPRDEASGEVGIYRETWLWCGVAQDFAVKQVIERDPDDVSPDPGSPKYPLESPWQVFTGSRRLGRSTQFRDHHVDLWEVHMDPDRTIHVTSDGGVARKAPEDDQFYQWAQGLTAHLIAGLTRGPVDNTGAVSLAYGTFDNGGRSSKDGGATWKIHIVGDSSDCLGDEGSEQAIVLRHLHSLGLVRYGLEDRLGSLGTEPQALFPCQPRLLLQSMRRSKPTGEADKSELDVVMLVADPTKLEATALMSPTIPVAPLIEDMKGETLPLLIRGRALKERMVDWYGYWSKIKPPAFSEDWRLEFVRLPSGAVAFWAGGGPVDAPTYYLLDSGGRLWRRAPAATPPDAGFVRIGAMALGFVPTARTTSHETLFVDPYRPQRLFVFGTVAAGGILFSQDYGKTLTPDPVLQALVTASGRHPYRDNLTGRSSANQIGPRNTISCMAFHPGGEEVAAGSLFGGVFVRDSKGVWRDLSWLFPEPQVMVAGLAMTKEELFVGTHGYGLWRIRGYGRAPLATYFVPRSGKDPPDQAATLYDSLGQVIVGGQVLVRARRDDDVYSRSRGGREDVVTTDGQGRISVASLNRGQGRYVVHLRYGGDGPLDPLRLGRLAPCQTTVML